MKNGLSSLLTGILIGGAAALLLAPEKGEDTRKNSNLKRKTWPKIWKNKLRKEKKSLVK